MRHKRAMRPLLFADKIHELLRKLPIDSIA